MTHIGVGVLTEAVRGAVRIMGALAVFMPHYPSDNRLNSVA
ncbi:MULTISPECIES: hypothetical protein [unclassified Moraxella]